jgi:hypothetical protein
MLAKDNHHLLRTIRRHQLISAYGKLFIWLILVIITALSYQVFVRPYVDALMTSGVPTTQAGAFSIPTTTPFGKLINSLKAGQ